MLLTANPEEFGLGPVATSLVCRGSAELARRGMTTGLTDSELRLVQSEAGLAIPQGPCKVMWASSMDTRQPCLGECGIGYLQTQNPCRVLRSFWP